MLPHLTGCNMFLLNFNLTPPPPSIYRRGFSINSPLPPRPNQAPSATVWGCIIASPSVPRVRFELRYLDKINGRRRSARRDRRFLRIGAFKCTPSIHRREHRHRSHRCLIWRRCHACKLSAYSSSSSSCVAVAYMPAFRCSASGRGFD